MNRNSYLRLFVLIFGITVLFAACKKGDTGPAGSNGANGATGPAGPQGPKGDTGTANVIYSAWLDLVYTADTIHIGSVVDTIGFFADISAAKLSSTIITSGEMKVYVNFGTTAAPDVFLLPYSDVYSGLSIVPEFMLQKIHIYSNGNVSTITKNGLKIFQYRYILIPGSVTGRLIQGIDWNDYAAVKNQFLLKG